MFRRIPNMRSMFSIRWYPTFTNWHQSDYSRYQETARLFLLFIQGNLKLIVQWRFMDYSKFVWEYRGPVSVNPLVGTQYLRECKRLWLYSGPGCEPEVTKPVVGNRRINTVARSKNLIFFTPRLEYRQDGATKSVFHYVLSVYLSVYVCRCLSAEPFSIVVYTTLHSYTQEWHQVDVIIVFL